MPTLKTTYHKFSHEPEPTKAKTWGRGGVDDIKFYKSKYWRDIRSQQLRLEPICRECNKNDKFVTANVVDHILERHNGGSDLPNNLQSLCRSCHNSKTGKIKNR